MLSARLSRTGEWRDLVAHPVLLRSLEWVAAEADRAAEGIHEMGRPGWYVNVHGYETLPETECVWENHRRTVDIQYLMEGVEAIAVAPVERLGEPVVR